MKNIKIIILSLLMIFGFTFETTSVVYANEVPQIETSDVLNDLKSDSSFDESKYPLNTLIDNSKSIEAITLFEYNYQSLYLYIYNANGKNLKSRHTRITMATHEDLDIYNHYDLKLISSTSDNRFYKYKITDYNGFSKGKYTKRIYYISEIEFDFGVGYSEGLQATIAQKYFYNGFGENLTYYAKKLDVIEINVTASNYRTNTLNPRSTKDKRVYTDIFYITFPIQRKYGDLIGIDLTWKEKTTHEYTDYGSPKGHSSITTKDYRMQYTNEDLTDIKSISEIGGWEQFKVNLNPYNWFQDQDTNYNLPVIEKLNYPYDNKSYYLNEDTIKLLKDNHTNDVLNLSDEYIIRFSYKDFCNSSWTEYYSTLHVGSGGIWSGTPMNRAYTAYDKLKTEIYDCDVLTLTFCKDGSAYTIATSSKPVDHDPGWDNPTSSFEEKLKELLEKLKNVFKWILIILSVLLFAWIFKIIYPFLKIVFNSIKKLINKAINKRSNK